MFIGVISFILLLSFITFTYHFHQGSQQASAQNGGSIKNSERKYKEKISQK